MDRFIADDLKKIQDNCKALKSNMDRFIDRQTIEILSIQTTLKSNMDRFIVEQINIPLIRCNFKIQYG